jgi:hypothetical protein
MKVNYRNRRTAWEQLRAIEFALDSLINSTGRHKKQFELMSDELKNYFLTIKKLLGPINAAYTDFLWKQSCENEKLAKKFLPDCLKEKLELVKQARKQF